MDKNYQSVVESRDFTAVVDERKFGHFPDTANRTLSSVGFTDWGQTDITLDQVLSTYEVLT